jgi:hypothetical protein
MTRTWRNVRAQAVAAGQINEERVAQRRAEALAEVRAYRLTELRRATRLNQESLARKLGISQSGHPSREGIPLAKSGGGCSGSCFTSSGSGATKRQHACFRLRQRYPETKMELGRLEENAREIMSSSVFSPVACHGRYRLKVQGGPQRVHL